MGLSSGEASIDETNRRYYDEYIFPDDESAIATVEQFAATAKEDICKIDSTFKKADLAHLASELAVLRLEVFALAWLHWFGHESAIDQRHFTRIYLQDMGRSDLWEHMADYNEAIADSVVSEKEKAWVGAITNARFRITKEWIAGFGGIDEAKSYFGTDWKQVARQVGQVANTVMAEDAWDHNIVQFFLAAALWKRLGLGDMSRNRRHDEAIRQLSIWINSMYDDASRIIESESATASERQDSASSHRTKHYIKGWQALLVGAGFLIPSIFLEGLVPSMFAVAGHTALLIALVTGIVNIAKKRTKQLGLDITMTVVGLIVLAIVLSIIGGRASQQQSSLGAGTTFAYQWTHDGSGHTYTTAITKYDCA